MDENKRRDQLSISIDGPIEITGLSDQHKHLTRIEALLHTVIKQGELIMSKISEYTDRVKADYAKVGTNLDNLVADVKALDDKITELQNSSGTISPADQALLDEAQTLSSGLVDRTQAMADAHPEPPPAPPA